MQPALGVRRERRRAGATFGRRRQVDEKDEFAPLAIRVGREPGHGLGERHPCDGFEFLGELARDDELALAAEHVGQRGRRGGDPMRCLVDQQRARQRGGRGEQLAARLCVRRQKPEKEESVGNEPGRRNSGDRRIRAWNRHHRKTGVQHRTHQPGARVADGGRAGIADQRHAAARAQGIEDTRDPPFLVVLVQRQWPRGDAEVPQQHRGHPRVFGRHHVGAAEDVDAAQCDVAQITERRGNHI